MNKIFKRVLSLALCIVMTIPFIGSADELKPWYMDYTTEYGTRLTRDWNFELGDKLNPVYSMEMKENFFTFRDELPDEIPVWAPYTDEEIAQSKNKLYIAPDGDDSNPGTIDKPLKTLEKATKLAKTHKKGGLTIYLREGTYSNTAGHVVGRDASGTDQKPTFVSAYPGEKVTLTSAISVKGSDMKIADDEVALKKLNNNVKGKVYSVDLKELGYTEFGTFTKSARPTLYVDGTQYTIARWPNAENTGMVRYNGTDGEYGVIDSGDVTTAAGKTGEYRVKGNGFEFVMSSSRPLNWENTGNIWMYGYWYEEWDKQYIQVRHFDAKKNSVRSVHSDPYGILHQNHNSYYFFNVLEELDTPGEWFVDDKSGMLYLYPSSPLDNSNVMITTSVSDGLKADLTENIVFNELNIDTAGKNGIATERSRKTIFQNCTVRNAANNGVDIRGYHTGILNCDIEGRCGLTSPTGAQDDGTAGYTTWNPTCNFVQNSIVQGMLQPSWGMHDIISHNLVTGSTAQSLYAHREFEAIFEYNEVVAGPNQTLDSGLIYFGCTAIHRGNHARYNYLNRATPVMRSGIAYGIYFDDISSQNYAYGNIVREAGLFFHGGSNNVAYNNIFVDMQNGGQYVAQNSNNYKLTAERWPGMIISDTDTRWSRQKRSTYQGHWMNRYVNDYEMITNLLFHKHDWESTTYDITNDERGVYATRPKDNYYANNLFVNCQGDFNRTILEERAVYENNVRLDYIPEFEDYKDGIYNLTEEQIKAINPEMEALPSQHKMGLIYDPAFKREKMSLATPVTLSPLNTTEDAVYENENVTLTWSKVFGFSYYNVEVATDPEFENVVFQKTVQTTSAIVPELNLDTTYYWRVTVGTWTHEFDMTPKTSKVATFRIGNEEEILANTVIELASVNSNISALEDRILMITEDYNKDLEKSEADRIYTSDPAEALIKLVASFHERKLTDIKFKKDVDLFIKTIQREFINKWGEFVKPHVTYVNDYLTSTENIKITGKADIAAIDKGYELKPQTGVAMYAAKEPVLFRPNATYKTRMKFETIGPWNCLNLMQSGNTASNPTATSSYFVVFKSDLIELQRYPKDSSWKNGIVQQFENDKTVVKDNTWFDVEYKFEYPEEGIRVTVSIDGKEYFNYLDTLNLNYFYDNLGYMANQANGVMSVANPE